MRGNITQIFLGIKWDFEAKAGEEEERWKFRSGSGGGGARFSIKNATATVIPTSMEKSKKGSEERNWVYIPGSHTMGATSTKSIKRVK